MYKVKPRILKKIINKHYDTKTPLFIRGGFGIGKSAISKEVAKEIAKRKGKEYLEWNNLPKKQKHEIFKQPEKYFIMFDERLSQYEPSDLRGLPMFDKSKNDSVIWKIPLWLEYTTLPNSDGFIFFDEINNAPPSILKACYQIYLDKQICEYKVNENFLVLGAGNRIEDKADIFDIPQPLLDRQSEVEMVIDDEEWFNWAFKNNIDSRIITFLKFRPDYLLKIDNNKDVKSTTPRGWERVSNLIKGEEDEDIEDFVSVAISEGVALEFLAFLKLQRKVDIEAIIKNPKKIKEITEIDLKCSAIGGFVAYYQKDVKHFEGIVKISNELEEEFGILLLRLLLGTKPKHFKSNVIKLDVWKNELSQKFIKFLID